MKLVAPDYYEDFKCIADKCRHSCCIGWEIDIDADTYEKYRNVSGEIGERLKKGISYDGENASFILDANERCPFLNNNGLCDIITNLGEDSLCQICTDHPRFRNFLSDRIEIGLGMCCEAAAKLVLGRKEKTVLNVISDDGNNEILEEYDSYILELRTKLLEILQDRTVYFEDRVLKALNLFEISLEPQTNSEIAEEYKNLERLDSNWDKYLDLLRYEKEYSLESTKWDIPLEQFSCYLIYRHFTVAADDGLINARIALVADFIRFIIKLTAVLDRKGTLSFEEFSEAVRMFSSEIEYSEENTEHFLSKYEFL